jgi:hypothetical protein
MNVLFRIYTNTRFDYINKSRNKDIFKKEKINFISIVNSTFRQISMIVSMLFYPYLKPIFLNSLEKAFVFFVFKASKNSYLLN